MSRRISLARRWRNQAFPILGAIAMLVATAGPAWSQEILGSRVNGLMTFDFSDNYITPRGLHVEDEGLVTQPLLLLFWKLHAANQGAVSDVTLATGLWNSFHSHRAGVNPSRWNEIDPILNLSVKFRNGLTLDTGMTAFYTPTDSYETSTHAEFKLTYNDSPGKRFSVNPWVAYWVELQNKATVVFDPATSSRGSYLTIGATPTIGLGRAGATLDVATYANIVSSDFYQRFDGSGGGSGLAIVSLAPKVNIPVKFLGVTHGAWTAYAGFSYYYLRNQGLLDGNQVLGNESGPDQNLTRIRGGLSVFF
jgi:hypothetical protein